MNGECNSDNLDLSQEQRMQIVQNLQAQIKLAKANSVYMANLSALEKNYALELIERELRESVNFLVDANQKDLQNPDNADLSPALKDRLMLNSERVMSIANAVRKLINIKDPVNEILDGWQHPKGMQITKIRVPIGVVGIIYEARPNVTVDAIALAIKSGNAAVLRGSRQAWHTNLAIMQVIERALEQTSVPFQAIQYLKDQSREGCKVLLKASNEIDLVIPRGSESLNQFVLENATVPVMGAGGGLCHTYIDQDADIEKAVAVVVNAKVQRPSVCNSCESILVHEDIAEDVLGSLIQALIKNDVEIFADTKIIKEFPFLKEANEKNYQTEYLDLKVSLKTVANIEEAVEHINAHSTGHSEAIITEDIQSAEFFKKMIQSACVYVNVSTRFTDGEEFGYGAEMGISTGKLHARGPIGLKELCTYKFLIDGDGQTK